VAIEVRGTKQLPLKFKNEILRLKTEKSFN